MLGDVLTIGSLTLVKPMTYSPMDELLSAAGYVRMTPSVETDAWSDKAWVIERNLHPPSSDLQSSDTTEDSLVMIVRSTWHSPHLSMPRILSENEQDISVAMGMGLNLFIITLRPADRHRTSKDTASVVKLGA